MIDCTEWHAWYSSRGRGGTTLHVIGECRATFSEAHLVLRPHHVPSAGEISVRGPDALDRSAPPPVLTVKVPAGRYYALEFATSLRLLDRTRRLDRRDTNFFASWSAAPPTTSPQYRLPDAVWSRLRKADRLFYRVITTARTDSWEQAVAWPAQWADAPFIRIGAPGADVRTLTLVVAFRDATTPVEIPASPLRLRLDRRSDEVYAAVAILTSDITIPFDVAR